jgi:DNA polymerase V
LLISIKINDIMQIKNLVVADSSRTEKTICLAISPSLKQYGIPGRARLFEVVQKVREINTNRNKNKL